MPTTIMKYPEVQNYFGGKFIPCSTNRFLDVISHGWKAIIKSSAFLKGRTERGRNCGA